MEGNARCDIVGRTLRDGDAAWHGRTISRRREWVHEGEGSMVLAAGPDAALARVYRSSLRYFVARANGFRSVPAPPRRWSGAPGASQYAQEVGHCVTGSRVLRITAFSPGPPAGTSFVSSLDLRTRRWSKNATIVGPAGPRTYIPVGCRREEVLAFSPPATLARIGSVWSTIASPGTPTLLNQFVPLVATGSNLVVQGVDLVEGRPGPVRWLRGTRWYGVDAGPTFPITRGAPIAALGDHVVGLVSTATGVQIRVLRPEPLSG